MSNNGFQNELAWAVTVTQEELLEVLSVTSILIAILPAATRQMMVTAMASCIAAGQALGSEDDAEATDEQMAFAEKLDVALERLG